MTAICLDFSAKKNNWLSTSSINSKPDFLFCNCQNNLIHKGYGNDEKKTTKKKNAASHQAKAPPLKAPI